MRVRAVADAVRHLPRVPMNDVELIGPSPPHGGAPGWLLRRRIQGEEVSVASQVRLASLTELLGAHAAPGLYRPVLLAPGGNVLTSLGTPLPPSRERELAQGPEIAPGWRPAMLRDPDRLPATSASFRYLLMALAAASGGAIIWLYLHLSARMRRQITPLIEGARAVAHGDLNWRIESHGGDEIAVLSSSLNQMSSKLRSMIDGQIEVEKRAVLGEFATSVAHEVRNPLATMKASVQGLMMSGHDAERRSMLGVIVDEVERMNDVIMISAHGDTRAAVQAVKVGAHDYLTKPFDLQDLIHLIRAVTERKQLADEVSYLRSRDAQQKVIISGSAVMKRLDRALERVALSNARTILLLGPSGTGKALVAHSLHALSERAGGPFVELKLRFAARAARGSGAVTSTAIAPGPICAACSAN